MSKNNWEEIYYEKALNNLGESKVQGKKVEKIIEMIKGAHLGTRILEIGCGEGSLAIPVPSGVSYTGVDVSSYAITNALKKFTNKENISFQVAPSDALPFPDKSFDLIIAFYSLEHMDKPEKSLKEMLRVLKQKGRIIICAPNLEFPFAYPYALRHKPFMYKFYFWGMRLKDYFLRFFGFLSFRTISENFLEATGRYEHGDDDLRHLVSGYEVDQFFRVKGFSIQSLNDGKISFLRYLISLLPGLSYYGRELFIVVYR